MMGSAPAVLQSWGQASEQIVTNCDIGASCGALPLLYTTAGVVALVLGLGYVRRFRR